MENKKINYPYYIYRCKYCGNRTIFKNDKFNPFFSLTDDDVICTYYSNLYGTDIIWTCPCCIDKYIEYMNKDASYKNY